MSRVLHKPDQADLPPGPRRDLVDFLFTYYEMAVRPDLQKIADHWHHMEDKAVPGTTSRETIRKMLRGESIPPKWKDALTVLLLLCDLADIDPDDPLDGLGGWGQEQTHTEHFQDLWNRALNTTRPPTRRERAAAQAAQAKLVAAVTRRRSARSGG
jgi:hypothetical protein